MLTRIVISLIAVGVFTLSLSSRGNADCGSASSCNYSCSGVASGMSYYWFQNPCDSGGKLYVDVLNTSGGSASFVVYKNQSCTAQHVVANSGCLNPGGDGLLVFDASQYVPQYFLVIGKCSGSAVYVVEISWDCNEPPPTECEPGYDVGSVKSCGACGKKICQADLSWGECYGQGPCSPGASENQGCGKCGTKTRNCSNQCAWSSWGTCNGQGDCSPGQSDAQACGKCGTKTRNCSNQCVWSSWGACNGQGPCSSGQNGSSQACGNCGTKTQTCSNSCQWEWGQCDGEGPCAPGQVGSSQACGNCGTKTQICSDSCKWQWGQCDGEGECSPWNTQACGDCGTMTCNGNCDWGTCEGENDALCKDGLCCTDDLCSLDGLCINTPIDCQPGRSCQENTCQCVEGCGQFTELPQCQGAVLFWCENNELKQEDCGANGDICVPEVPAYCCGPDCAGKDCGGDGCGEACGECEEGSTCVGGICDCVPDCAGKDCGDNGCGTLCGTCPEDHYCENGQCKEGDCMPDCVGKECGNGGCEDEPGACGMCDNEEKCKEGECVEEGACVPDCIAKECGENGCGGTCGDCPQDKPFCIGGNCEKDCEPDCVGKECGTDGCGGICGACPAVAPDCVGGKCELKDVCVPDCTGHECGSDGCGGDCGMCPAAAPICEDHLCVPQDPPDDDVDAGSGEGGCAAASTNATAGFGLLLALFGLLMFLGWYRHSRTQHLPVRRLF